MRDGSVSGINENERFCYAQRDEVPAGVIRRRLPELGVQDMNDAGVILMPNGSHVIIAIFATHSPPEAVIANIARQMLKQ